MQELNFKTVAEFDEFHKALCMLNKHMIVKEEPKNRWNFDFPNVDKMKAAKHFNGLFSNFFAKEFKPFSNIDKTINSEYKIYQRDPYETMYNAFDSRNILNHYVFKTIVSEEVLPIVQLYDINQDTTKYIYQYELSTGMNDEMRYNNMQFTCAGRYPFSESELAGFINDIQALHTLQFMKELVDQCDIKEVVNTIECCAILNKATEYLGIHVVRNRNGFILTCDLENQGMMDDSLFKNEYKSLGSLARAFHKALKEQKDVILDRMPDSFNFINGLITNDLNMVVFQALSHVKPNNAKFYNCLAKAANEVKQQNYMLTDEKENEMTMKM